MIYFLQAGEQVKIGYTRDEAALLRRTRAIQTGQPSRLSLLRLIAGGRDEEGWLHSFFRDRCLGGEWFSYAEAMMDIVPPLGGWRSCATTFVGVRIPNELLAAMDAAAPSRTKAIVTALTAYYLPASEPEPSRQPDKAA